MTAAVAPCSVYASPRWLEVQTLGGRAPSRVITAPDAAGAPRAWLAIHDRLPTRNPRYAIARLCRGFPQPLAAASYVGLASGYHADVAMRAGADVLAEVLTEALASGPAQPLIVPFATDRLARAIAAIVPDAPRVLEAADAWLLGAGRSLDDWQAGLARRVRQDIRHDERQFAAAGLTESIEPLGASVAAFAELVSLHARRYGLDEPVAALAPHLAAIAQVFGDDALLFAARRAGRLVAAALGLLHGEHIYMRMVGNDHGAVAGTAAHFVLSYYRPLALCAARGLAGVHLGLSTDRTKRSRGATLEPLWTIVLGAAPGQARVDGRALLADRLAELARDDPGTASALEGRVW